MMVLVCLINKTPVACIGVSQAYALNIFEEGFEAGSPQTFLSEYYGNLNASSRYSIQSAMKASGTYGLRYQFVTGTSNVDEYVTQHFGDSQTGPVYPEGAGNHFYDIYVEFKLRYSPGYDWSAGNNKIVIIGTQDDRTHGNACCNPWVSHYITLLAGNIGTRGFFNAEGNNKRSTSGQWFGLSPNINGYSSSNQFFIEPGKWYTIEIHKRLNDEGQSNGIFEMWIEGLKVTGYFNVLYRVPWDGSYGSNLFYGTNFMMFTTYINNPAPQDQDMYYDDVKIGTTYIGVTNEAPNPPTGLKVVNN